MDNSLLENKYLAFIRANFLPLFLGIGGLLFVGYGLLSFSGQKQDKEDILFEAAHDVSSEAKNHTAASKKQQITVDVEGAVLKPGIYKLEADSRVHDALIAAGGMAKNADRTKVTKSLNLAAKLVDGGKLYIPFEGEHALASTGESSTDSTILGADTNGSLNVNTATQKELEALPGIGEVTAQKIIEGRPYSSIEELQQKKIVGQKVFGQIKEKITTY